MSNIYPLTSNVYLSFCSTFVTSFVRVPTMGRNAQNRNTHQIRNHICGERTEFSSTSHSPLSTPHQYQSAKTSLNYPIWNTNDERMSHLKLPHDIEHQIGAEGFVANVPTKSWPWIDALYCGFDVTNHRLLAVCSNACPRIYSGLHCTNGYICAQCLGYIHCAKRVYSLHSAASP